MRRVRGVNPGARRARTGHGRQAAGSHKSGGSMSAGRSRGPAGEEAGGTRAIRERRQAGRRAGGADRTRAHICMGHARREATIAANLREGWKPSLGAGYVGERAVAWGHGGQARRPRPMGAEGWSAAGAAHSCSARSAAAWHMGKGAVVAVKRAVNVWLDARFDYAASAFPAAAVCRRGRGCVWVQRLGSKSVLCQRGCRAAGARGRRARVQARGGGGAPGGSGSAWLLICVQSAAARREGPARMRASR
jgi:hypothetical protein